MSAYHIFTPSSAPENVKIDIFICLSAQRGADKLSDMDYLMVAARHAPPPTRRGSGEGKAGGVNH
jgi:hypothetical protein